MHKHSQRALSLLRPLYVFLIASLFLRADGLRAADLSDLLAPDTILYNGKIITVDAQFSIAEAVAIKGGRFVAVGSNSDVLALARASTQKTDLQGRTVLPGFQDPHLHLAGAAGELPDPYSRRLAGARSIAEMLAIIGEKVKSAPPGKLVWFSEGPSTVNQLAEKRWPTRKELDTVSPANPILIARLEADYVWLTNSLGLAAARIDRNTPQPFSHELFGEFALDAAGDPTGVTMGRSSHYLLREALNAQSAEDLEKSLAQSVLTEVLPYGITSYADPLTYSNNQPTHHAYHRLMTRPEGYPARVNLMIRVPIRSLSTEDNLSLIRGLLFEPMQNDFLRIGTFKIALDKGRPGKGPYIVPKEKGKQILIESHRRRWQLYVHITTPETFDYACEALEEALKLYPRSDARHIFTHIGQPTESNLATMKRLGIIADLQVGSLYRQPDDAEQRRKPNPQRPDLGPNPVATYRNAGIPVILSSDQAPIGPLYSIWAAVTRVRKSGKVFRPEERLELKEAIRAVTSLAAWASFQERSSGSIEAGKLADLVVLGRDILTVDPLTIKDIPVLMTMTHGKFVYVNPNTDPSQKVMYKRYPSRTSFLDGEE